MTGKETDRSDPDHAAGIDPVALAEKNFNRVLLELDELADELHARGGDTMARAARLASEARNAIQAIFNERHRIEKLHNDSPDAGRAELDLAAAKLEIGRRLALLRERGEAEGLSRRAE